MERRPLNARLLPRTENLGAVKSAFPDNAGVVMRAGKPGERGNKNRQAFYDIGNKVNAPLSKATKLDKRAVVEPVKPIASSVSRFGVNLVTDLRKALEAELPPGIEDVDNDCNLFLVGRYARLVYTYLRKIEPNFRVSKPSYFQHLSITSKMRFILVDWLIELHKCYELNTETLFQSVSILDRFLEKATSVDKTNLQLVGLTSFFIASKFEETHPPSSSDLIISSDGACTVEELYQTEKLILNKLNFRLGDPTPIDFLRRYGRIAELEVEYYKVSKFLAELSLLDAKFSHRMPSELAAAAVYIATVIQHRDSQQGNVSSNRKDWSTFPSKLWTPSLEFYSGLKFSQIEDLARQLLEYTRQYMSQSVAQTALKEKYRRCPHVTLNF